MKLAFEFVVPWNLESVIFLLVFYSKLGNSWYLLIKTCTTDSTMTLHLCCSLFFCSLSLSLFENSNNNQSKVLFNFEAVKFKFDELIFGDFEYVKKTEKCSQNFPRKMTFREIFLMNNFTLVQISFMRVLLETTLQSYERL